MKLAYTDLYRYNRNPRFAKIPVRGLLSKEYAEQRAAVTDPQKANCAVVNGTPAQNDTTYLAVVDKEGNIASLIESVYDYFGSGVAVKDRGFLLHDRGGLFVLDPKHPNALAPHKRPFHAIISAFMERGDEHIGFGIKGSSNRRSRTRNSCPTSWTMDGTSRQRFRLQCFTLRDTGESVKCTIVLESRVSPEVQPQLRQKGRDLILRKD